MNELTKEKTMTVKEVAEVLGVSDVFIRKTVKELFPEIVRNGIETNLNEIHVTKVKMEIEKNPYLIQSYKVETELEMLILQKKLDLWKNKRIETLQNNVKLLSEQKEKAESQVKMLVHDFNKLYTTTEISKELNLKSAQELNNILMNKHIQYKQNGTWILYFKYSDSGYTSIKETVLDSGKIVYDRLWTGIGRQFILNLFEVK